MREFRQKAALVLKTRTDRIAAWLARFDAVNFVS